MAGAGERAGEGAAPLDHGGGRQPQEQGFGGASPMDEEEQGEHYCPFTCYISYTLCSISLVYFVLFLSFPSKSVRHLFLHLVRCKNRAMFLPNLSTVFQS